MNEDSKVLLDALRRDFMLHPKMVLDGIAKKDYSIDNPEDYTSKELIDKMIGIEFSNHYK